MLYSIIRIVLALAGAAVVFVMLVYKDEERKYMMRSAAGSQKAWVGAGATFAAAVVALHLIPVENLITGFSTPEKAFLYNHTGEILEIDERGDCAFVIVSTGDEKITTHVLPLGKDGKWPEGLDGIKKGDAVQVAAFERPNNYTNETGGKLYRSQTIVKRAEPWAPTKADEEAATEDAAVEGFLPEEINVEFAE